MQELKPHHIELCGCGSSPLTRFEEDEAYGFAGAAFLLESRYEYALGIAESKQHIGTRVFVVYAHECSCPEGEVVAIAEAYELARDFADVVGCGFASGYIAEECGD